MASDALILRTDAGHVTHLTLNRPGTLNALSREMLEALDAALTQIAEDRGTRVVVLDGAGKAFCAGHDLREMSRLRAAPDKGRAELSALFDLCTRVMTRIRTLPQPVIAQVHGIATAAGCQLVATCDMAVAAEDTRFGVNGVNIGLFCSTPMVALSRNLPRKQAFELLSTGAFIDAERAATLGLVNRIVPGDRLGSETRALAETVASKLPTAVRTGKRLFYDQLETGAAEAYEMTGRAMVENMLDADTAEGVAAFIEKRKPNWA